MDERCVLMLRDPYDVILREVLSCCAKRSIQWCAFRAIRSLRRASRYWVLTFGQNDKEEVA